MGGNQSSNGLILRINRSLVIWLNIVRNSSKEWLKIGQPPARITAAESPNPTSPSDPTEQKIEEIDVNRFGPEGVKKIDEVVKFEKFVKVMKFNPYERAFNDILKVLDELIEALDEFDKKNAKGRVK